jgi:hypothetical protein
MDMHAKTEELLERLFSMQSFPRLYNKYQRNKPVFSWQLVSAVRGL